MIPLNWKLRLPPGHGGLPVPLHQQAKRGVPVLAQGIGLLTKGKLDGYSTVVLRKKTSETREIPEAVSYSTMPVIKVNVKVQQSNPGRIINGPYPPG